MRIQVEQLKKQLEAKQATSGGDAQANLNEIQSLKAEVSKLTKERKLYKEEHKENKQLKQSVEKLNGTLKEMQETNDFLTSQINNLNQHIFELNNGQAENKENSQVNEATETLDSQRLINKPLARLTGSVAPGSSSNANATLNQVDMNNSNFSTPTRSNMNKTVNLSTPSSSVKKQNQCAQQ